MSESLDASFGYCQSVARTAGRNFYFSFLALPRTLFRDMCALYAFMRETDDIGDDHETPVEIREQLIEAWRIRLHQALETDFDAQSGPANVSEPPSVFPAMADVVRRHSIPIEYLEGVIDGVRGDLERRRFESFNELAGYCYQVAGCVGLCCIHIWGFNDDRAIPAAIACGEAFQLTNILRDLREDAVAGRIYVPQDELARFDVSEDQLREGRIDAGFRDLMKFQVSRARERYRSGVELLSYLQPDGRPILTAMLRIYGGLLKRIEQCNYDVFSERVSLSKVRKLGIALGSYLGGKAPRF